MTPNTMSGFSGAVSGSGVLAHCMCDTRFPQGIYMGGLAHANDLVLSGRAHTRAAAGG